MKVLVLLFSVAAASASVINTRYCPNSNLEVCEINKIIIDPCEGGAATCKIARGTDAHISFDFTPHFTASSLIAEVRSIGQVFAGLDSDACKATTCPTVSNTMQTYNTSLHLGKKLPKGFYEFEWSLTDATNTNNRCCFLARAKLLK